ncbi:MAG: penicillin-binding protein 2 [Cyanobacteria bacterium RUI128]|nr:penicillin-binding protein 2 [Cyanobacteria bacterium RUI128]
MKKASNKDVSSVINKRITFVQGFISFVFFILIVYLFSIQVLDFSGYKSKGIAIRTTDNQSLRGDILDRNGVKLATDEIVYEIYAHPTQYSAKYPPEVLADKLAPLMGMPRNELLAKLKSKKHNIITIKKNVDRLTAEKVRNEGFRAISVGTINRRFYPQGSIASHIIGYYSYLSGNSEGIENIANDKLGNVAALNKVQRKSNGDIIFDFDTDVKNLTQKPKGEDVTLTIDSAVQYICEKELAKTIHETHAERGVVIVTDVTNGEVLAYASYPNFNPNTFWKASSKSMKNWSLTDVYPPGSTFKILTVATALDLGVLNENSRVPDSGRIFIDKNEIKNNDYSAHPNPGMISLVYLFEHSSNVGSANIALMIDKNAYYSKLRDFGIGQKTGIDLTGESIGIFPKPKSWYKSRHASMGYGYGASVTAIQMISAVSAIANGGIWITPHVIKYSQEELPKHVVSRRVVSEQTAKAVTRLLAKSIANGKTPLNLEKYTTCAKTGTSNKNFKKGGNMVYASAIGYFPSSAPKIAIYVVIDSPKTGVDFGGTIASPLFRKIATDIGTVLNIPSDKK